MSDWEVEARNKDKAFSAHSHTLCAFVHVYFTLSLTLASELPKKAVLRLAFIFFLDCGEDSSLPWILTSCTISPTHACLHPAPFLAHGLHPFSSRGLGWLWEIISVPSFSLLGWAQCAVLTACWWVSWFRYPCCGLYSWSEDHHHQVSFDFVIFKKPFFLLCLY